MNRKPTEKTSETQKAKKLIDKDVPDADKSANHEESRNQEPQPFRPDENVDNQKAVHNSSSPAHNTSIKETPIPGAQLSKEKKTHKDNIENKTKKASSKASK
ncbi:hypothetical protein QT231_23995 [Halomonas sp. SpR1]|uniref:hypothetical protein n=1 Tax=Halomonas sp. SpR1 TaxID=3050462 RepID=UPI0027E572EA|nr:hypothetical protein [Halomonas sp. SpR1]MDQ7735766.1 hypothetical protein [Halomonas sp. SpR1]